MRSLAEDRDIIIKTADKGSCVVVWGREDYLAEGYKQLTNTSLTFKSRSTMINYYLNLQKRVTSFLNDYIITSWLLRRNLNNFHITLRIPVV